MGKDGVREWIQSSQELETVKTQLLTDAEMQIIASDPSSLKGSIALAKLIRAYLALIENQRIYEENEKLRQERWTENFGVRGASCETCGQPVDRE